MVDFLLSEHRDIAAGIRFFTHAIRQHGAPKKVTLDGYPATHSAIAELQASRSSTFGNKGLDKQIPEQHSGTRSSNCLLGLSRKFNETSPT